MDNKKVLSVSGLNYYIAQLFSADEVLNEVTVRGEISNFKHHSSGHLYFSLKDSDSKINCVMFRGNSLYLKFEPEDGMEVEVYGRVGVYEKNGDYQIYVSAMKKAGQGNLYEKYKLMLEQLEKKGYFEAAHKKDIPYMPKKVALVTSPTGAAIRDMISVIKRRFPITQIIVCPVLVQGEEAAYDIAQMIYRISENKLADIILLARGGGSIEELWAFNELPVAEAIYHCEIPVISGVGHETDFTVADFVADMRAPTPSVAAELAVPDIAKLKNSLNSYNSTLYEAVMYKIKRYKDKLLHISKMPSMASPYAILEQKYMRLDTLSERLESVFNHRIELLRAKLVASEELLKSLSHENVLNRGYFMVKKNDLPVSIEELKISDNITLISRNMSAECEVKNIKEM